MGIQYTPVDSIASGVTRQATNQASRACKSGVKVPKHRTGVASRSAGTQAQISLAPMSSPAALGLTTFQTSFVVLAWLGIRRALLFAPRPGQARMTYAAHRGRIAPPPGKASPLTRTILRDGLPRTSVQPVLACRALPRTIHPLRPSFCRGAWRPAPWVTQGDRLGRAEQSCRAVDGRATAASGGQRHALLRVTG